MPTRKLFGIVALTVLILAAVGFAQTTKPKKGIDRTKTLVVKPFESAVQGAATLPQATREAVIQMMKDGTLFPEILTPEEAKDKDKATVLELEAKLVDFAAGSAAKRLMVGFGSGRAHAGFDFIFRDAATGDVVWTKRVKSTASFWFSGTTSSASQRQELPESVAKKLIEEVKKDK